MNTLEAQKVVIELLSLVYSKAAVVVGGQNAPMPSVPYVVVSFGAATKAPGQSAFLNVVDGKEVHTFLMQFTCTVELVTLGTPQGDGMQPLNTAVADLMQLGLFLNSEYAGDFMYDNDIDVSTSGDCLPIVNLRNGVSVPFRAQQTLTVSFYQTLEDMALIRSPGTPYTQTDSGADAGLAQEEAGYFTGAKIEYKE